MPRERHPKARYNPSGREIRTGIEPGNFDREKIAWGISRIDLDGRWGWGNLALDVWWQRILPKLRDFETMTWAEIQAAAGGRGRGGGNNSHNVPVAEICKEAQERLRELCQDDIDDLFSLRLQGTHRIYGIRDGRVLKILWFDANHEIVPVGR
jgi:hypothetical protein